MIRINSLLQFGQQILASTLLTYHVLIWMVDDRQLEFALSFILYGLFLLWQPLWSKETVVDKKRIAFLVLVFVGITYAFPNESLVFFAWAIMILYLLMEWKYKQRTIGAFATPCGQDEQVVVLDPVAQCFKTHARRDALVADRATGVDQRAFAVELAARISVEALRE